VARKVPFGSAGVPDRPSNSPEKSGFGAEATGDHCGRFIRALIEERCAKTGGIDAHMQGAFGRPDGKSDDGSSPRHGASVRYAIRGRALLKL
jgi:hypothetical protein